MQNFGSYYLCKEGKVYKMADLDRIVGKDPEKVFRFLEKDKTTKLEINLDYNEDIPESKEQDI